MRAGPGLFPPSPQNPHVPDKEPEPESELDHVIAFKYLFLVHEGFPPEEARLVALSSEADWHRALDLFEQGCDPTLIVRILT